MHCFSQYNLNMEISICLGGIFYPRVPRHMLSMIADSLKRQKTNKQKPGMVTNPFHSTYLIQLSYRFLKFIKRWKARGAVVRSVDERFSSWLKVALSIEGSGEGSVVQCPWWCPMAGVRRHPHDAILCLFRGEFSPQLLH